MPYPLLHLPYSPNGRAMFATIAPLSAIQHYFEKQPLRDQQRAIHQLIAKGNDLKTPESRYLALELRTHEHIKSLVHGHRDKGRTLLAATNQRAMIVDRRPHFIKSLEITYDFIDGISLAIDNVYADVTLHTKLGDYHIGQVPRDQAERMRDYIDTRLIALRHENGATHSLTS